jgi:hypothetical protein
MGLWRDLFLEGEYMPRERLLAGLTLADVTRRPAGVSHSIFEELWHAAKWQTCVVEGDKSADDVQFPSQLPADEREYLDLVKEFLAYAEKAVVLAEESDTATDVPLREELARLAMHNAYHLGKIVALRQVIGAWPPKADGP